MRVALFAAQFRRAQARDGAPESQEEVAGRQLGVPGWTAAWSYFEDCQQRSEDPRPGVGRSSPRERVSIRHK